MPSTSTLVDSIYTRRVSAGECYPPDLVKSQLNKEAPRRFEWNSPGNLCQITRKIRNEEPEWTATRYCFLGWV